MISLVVGKAYETKVINSLLYGLEHLPKVGFKLLLRRDNFIPVGIVTVKRAELDTGKGKYKLFAHGVSIGADSLKKKKFFVEPIVRWNGKEFEPTILCENDYGIMITARRSSSPDDNEENFMYLDNPFQVGEMEKIKEELNSKELTISSLIQEIESIKKEKNFWETEANSFGAEVRELRETVSRLSRELATARAQINFYQREANIAEGLSIQIDSAIRKFLADARERGMEIASADIERVIDSAEKLRKLREEMAGITPVPSTPAEIKMLRTQIAEINEKLEKLSGAKPPPATEK